MAVCKRSRFINCEIIGYSCDFFAPVAFDLVVDREENKDEYEGGVAESCGFEAVFEGPNAQPEVAADAAGVLFDVVVSPAAGKLPLDEFTERFFLDVVDELIGAIADASSGGNDFSCEDGVFSAGHRKGLVESARIIESGYPEGHVAGAETVGVAVGIDPPHLVEADVSAAGETEERHGMAESGFGARDGVAHDDVFVFHPTRGGFEGLRRKDAIGIGEKDEVITRSLHTGVTAGGWSPVFGLAQNAEAGIFWESVIGPGGAVVHDNDLEMRPSLCQERLV